MDFQIRRCRFQFEAGQSLHFPPGRTANILRGAFGRILRGIAGPSVYERIFAPRSAEGRMRDCPRPFVFRCAHLDGLTCTPGDSFPIDVHLFDLDAALPPWFERAFAELAAEGIGPGRGKARPRGVSQEFVTLPLDAASPGIRRVRVRFLTPTELKSRGEIALEPSFPILIARLHERISALRSLYGPGPLAAPDWDSLPRILTVARDLRWERSGRQSRHTGQVHPLSGFTGEAVYEGPLDAFLPLLTAGQWTGVGRQTVWGHGAYELLLG